MSKKCQNRGGGVFFLLWSQSNLEHIDSVKITLHQWFFFFVVTPGTRVLEKQRSKYRRRLLDRNNILVKKTFLSPKSFFEKNFGSKTFFRSTLFFEQNYFSKKDFARKRFAGQLCFRTRTWVPSPTEGTSQFLHTLPSTHTHTHTHTCRILPIFRWSLIPSVYVVSQWFLIWEVFYIRSGQKHFLSPQSM